MKCLADAIDLPFRSSVWHHCQVWQAEDVDQYKVALPNKALLDTIAVTDQRTGKPVQYSIVRPPAAPFLGKAEVRVEKAKEHWTGQLLDLAPDSVTLLDQQGKVARISGPDLVSTNAKFDARYMYLHVSGARQPLCVSYAMTGLSWTGYYVVLMREKMLELQCIARISNETGISFLPMRLNLAAGSQTYLLENVTLDSQNTSLCPILFRQTDLPYQRIYRVDVGNPEASLCYRFSTAQELFEGPCVVYLREETDQLVGQTRIEAHSQQDDVDLVVEQTKTVRAVHKVERHKNKISFETEVSNDLDEPAVVILRLEVGEKTVTAISCMRYERRDGYLEFVLDLDKRVGGASFACEVELA